MGAIYFPDLDIKINPSRVAFQLFGKDIYWYGIIIAAGFALAVAYGLKRAKKFGLTEDNILDMLFAAVPSAIVCARLYYCIFNWGLYKNDPVSVLYIWEGGMAIYGGVIGAVVSVLVFCKVKKLPFGPYGDIGSLGLLIGQSVGRWGNFMNREAHGAAYDGFLKMGIEDVGGNVIFYHPTFLYESVWNLIGFVILHLYSKKRRFDGEVFFLYVAWYGLGRAWIEGLRTDSLYLFGTGIRVSQLLALVSCVAAIIVLIIIRKKKLTSGKLYVETVAEIEAQTENSETFGG